MKIKETLHKYLNICTNHLRKETINNLVSFPNIICYTYEEGVFIIVPFTKENILELPKDLANILQYAINLDCSIVRLDRDADVVDELPVYEW